MANKIGNPKSFSIYYDDGSVMEGQCNSLEVFGQYFVDNGPCYHISFETPNCQFTEKKEDESNTMEEKYYYIGIVFPNNPKVYTYEVDWDMYDKIIRFNNLCAAREPRFFILNNSGSDYNMAEIVVLNSRCYSTDKPQNNIDKKIARIIGYTTKNTYHEPEIISCKTSFVMPANVLNMYSRFADRAFERIDPLTFAFKNKVHLSMDTHSAISNYKKICENENNNKGENKMNILGNVKFGKVNSGKYALTVKGLAMQNDNHNYIAYDTEANEAVNVDALKLDIDVNKFLYFMPVSLDQVQTGDIIMHCGAPVFVREVKDSTISVYRVTDQSIVDIVPEKNVFGFNFVTKIVNLLGGFNFAATSENPFGNMLPFLMMKDGDMNDMLPFFLMQNGGVDFQNNPMMMYMLFGKDNTNDVLPLMMMMNGNMFAGKAATGENNEKV